MFGNAMPMMFMVIDIDNDIDDDNDEDQATLVDGLLGADE